MIQRFLQRRTQGFTLIELLIVVAIIGIIAAILVPNLLDSLQKAKQRRTVADIRTIGSAWFSWYTDQVSGAAAGEPQSVSWPPAMTSTLDREALLALLQPSSTMQYIQRVPESDGWKRPFEFVITDDYDDQQSLMTRFGNIMGVRSLGRDSVPDSVYLPGPFLATDYDQDIVWADGYLVRFPGGVSTSSP